MVGTLLLMSLLQTLHSQICIEGKLYKFIYFYNHIKALGKSLVFGRNCEVVVKIVFSNPSL